MYDTICGMLHSQDQIVAGSHNFLEIRTLCLMHIFVYVADLWALPFNLSLDFLSCFPTTLNCFLSITTYISWCTCSLKILTFTRFLLCDFALMRLENLHRSLDLHNNFRFNVIWHRV
jgi:hypothetical protein